MKKSSIIIFALVLFHFIPFLLYAETNTLVQFPPSSNKNIIKSNDFEIVMVVKLEGVQWFDEMRKGIQDFAENTGVNAYQLGHHTGDPVAQEKIIEELIKKKVDAILVVPNDPMSLEPVLKKANEAGILTFSHEASSMKNVAYDIEAFENDKFGVEMLKALAENMDYKGEYAVIVGLLTMETHMQWADAAVEFQKKNYPKMKLITDPYIEDDNDRHKSYNRIISLINKNPKLKGILGCTADSAAAAGLAIEERGLTNKIFVSSLSLPSIAKSYLKNGSVQSISFWNPADAGYVTAWVAWKTLLGEKMRSGMNLQRPGYENIKVKGKIIYGNASIIATKKNVDNYDL
jgi:simple sugar transport system substrate-binding protein